MADAPPDATITTAADDAKSAAAIVPASSQPPRSSVYGRLPVEMYSYVAGADRTLLRLNKLLSTAAGLDSFLATLNYSFYLLAYVETRLPSRARLLNLLSLLLRRPSPKTPPAPSSTLSAATSFSLLAALVTETRTTLRLTALLPLYAWFRTLLAPQSPTSDPTLHLISLTQCTTYIAYQALENLAHLIDHRVPLLSIPTRLLAGPGSAQTWLLSNRLWLLGVTSDFFRLAREAQLEREGQRVDSAGKKVISRTKEEQQAVDRRWWNDLVVAGCWWPLCLHWSLEEGLWGVNDGVIGLLGVVAGLETFRGLWKETEGA